MNGKAALVTGAAGGLGRATALALADVGADVCLVDLDATGLNETAELLTASGVRTHIHATDLSVADNCKAAVESAVKAFGRLDALCNVAGVIFFSHAVEMRAAQWEKTLAVNLSAPFYLSQAAIPHLLEANGAIVNVASAAAFVGEAYLVAYAASKAGLVHLTKSLAMEFMHKPLRVNAVAPCGMPTAMGAISELPEGIDLTLVQRFSGLRGFVPTEDVADLVCFLASDAARSYHGTCLTIDAGITAG